MTGISVGVTIPIPGHTPVLAGLITATTPIGGILTGEAIIPIGGIIPAGEAAITTTRTRRTIGPTSYTALPTVRIGSGIEHRIDQFRRARPG